MAMTLEALLREGRNLLREAEIVEADLDAWLLMEFCFSLPRSRYFLKCREQAKEEEAQKYRALLQKRAEHIPLQHLTHQAWFMGRAFYVDERVLVPRQDTEILAEAAGEFLKPGMRVLDMCTGSGCLLLSLLLMREDCMGVGADLSEDALAVAQKNRSTLGISEEQAQLVHSDLFTDISGKFDLIVSNPPYIPSSEIDELSPEVRDHDPRMALDGREDGLWFYREITKKAKDYLKPGGGLYYEIGWNQGEDVARLLSEAGFSQIEIKKDYADLDRVVCGILKKGQENPHV